ncbi:MAG: glycosyltransferase family 39 protein, partial [Ignavibacteria bacterium]|nr:glycosyltransferase family 39 protein [Ignavibacteria bacterium]
MNNWRSNSLIFILFLVFNCVIWLRSFTLDFYNDEFQLIEYLEQFAVSNPFAVFSKEDLAGYYFRPIRDSALAIILKIFGTNPLPFRIINFFLYNLLIFLIYKIILNISNNKVSSIISALFFSLLPSHDIYLVWMPMLGDLLTMIFILLAFYYSFFHNTPKSFALSLLFVSLAFLTKESSYTAPLLFLAIAIFLPLKRKKFLSHFIGSSFALTLILIYRHFILNINLFQSTNFENLSFGSILLNFSYYSFASFIPTFAYSKENPLSIFLMFLILISLATAFIKLKRDGKKIDTNIILLSAIWYISFAIPISTLFMRWYVLLPSFGLLLITQEIIKSIEERTLLIFSFPIIIIFTTVNVYSMAGWERAIKMSKEILKEIEKIEIDGRDKALFWFFPEYYNNYPILRVGIQQAINYRREQKFSEILIPVSITLTENTKIELLEKNQSENEFYFLITEAKIHI